MKNLLLFTTFLCSVFFANAQFTTGQKLISGHLGFGFSNTKITNNPGVSNKNTVFSFSPAFSRFKSPNVMTGIGLRYQYNGYHGMIGDPVNEFRQNQHAFALFVNRTKLEPLAKKFYFTYTGEVNANYQVNHPNTRPLNPVNWYDIYGVSASGSIGLLYELNQRFLLSFELSNLVSISYHHTIEQGKTQTTTVFKNTSDNFGFSANLSGFNLASVDVGVKYLLKK